MKRPVLLFVFVLAALAALISLGTWQVKRLHWKEALLARLEAGIKAPPVAYSAWLKNWRATTGDPKARADLNFERVRLTGSFVNYETRYVYTVRDTGPGYLVFVPMLPSDGGRAVFVDRGFVPATPGAAPRIGAPPPQGSVTVSGIIRRPEHPGRFTPAPNKVHMIWYVSDLATMKNGVKEGVDASHYIEADPSSDQPGGPRGRDPKQLLAAIPNHHLQYAITWYGLALMLLAVYGFFLYEGRRKKDGGEA